MTRAEGPAALQHRTVRLLLHMDVRLHRDRLPAAHRVDGDLLVLRAGRGGEEKVLIQAKKIRENVSPPISVDGK